MCTVEQRERGEIGGGSEATHGDWEGEGLGGRLTLTDFHNHLMHVSMIHVMHRFRSLVDIAREVAKHKPEGEDEAAPEVAPEVRLHFSRVMDLDSKCPFSALVVGSSGAVAHLYACCVFSAEQG